MILLIFFKLLAQFRIHLSQRDVNNALDTGNKNFIKRQHRHNDRRNTQQIKLENTEHVEFDTLSQITHHMTRSNVSQKTETQRNRTETNRNRFQQNTTNEKNENRRMHRQKVEALFVRTFRQRNFNNTVDERREDDNLNNARKRRSVRSG